MRRTAVKAIVLAAIGVLLLAAAGCGVKVAAALGGTGGADLEETEAFLNEFADNAPEEIRGDFEVIADSYAKIADALGDVDVTSGETPSPEALEKLQELSTE